MAADDAPDQDPTPAVEAETAEIADDPALDPTLVIGDETIEETTTTMLLARFRVKTLLIGRRVKEEDPGPGHLERTEKTGDEIGLIAGLMRERNGRRRGKG